MRQILFAGAIGLILTLIGTPLLIKLLARKGYGQFIHDDGPRGHAPLQRPDFGLPVQGRRAAGAASQRPEERSVSNADEPGVPQQSNQRCGDNRPQPKPQYETGPDNDAS